MIRTSWRLGLLWLPCWVLAAGDLPRGTEARLAGHLLNRAAHGPSPAELKRMEEVGIKAWLESQWEPTSIDDSALEPLIAPLFEERGGERRIKGIVELKTLAHLYAVYSKRQLQSVLGEFWQNHFTTDYAKVAEYLDQLQNADASDALSTADARREAAHLVHREFEYFRANALGNFGDLLRFSARSPAMLIYLDGVLNVRGRPNENYAREILELHSFGVDNGYIQSDIEQLAKCLTGWGVAKVAPGDADKPLAPTGVQVSDRVLVAAAEATAGSVRDWSYFKGTQEPPVNWRSVDFDDSVWLRGPASIGYGDNDDATVLTDMAGNYTSLYLRKSFVIKDPAELGQHLILKVDVDDGFVAYLNGVEVARYNAPGKAGEIVPFKAVAPMGHEAGVPIQFNLNKLRKHLVAGKNVLAIQALNVSLGSSDLTLTPFLLDRDVLPGSIENSDPRGVFAFHYFPELHNVSDRKTLFKGSPQLLEVAGRAGPAGLAEAEEANARILDHPSTARFVCVKLIRKLVADEVDFRKGSEGPYAGLLQRCIEAWNAGTPKGNLKEVVKTILTSDEFWSERAFRSKVKDPFEFIASSLRVLDARTACKGLPGQLQAMGMELFTRKEPDGWPEVGTRLIEMGTFQKRLAFVLSLGRPAAAGAEFQCDPLALLAPADLENAEKIVHALNALLFQGTLTRKQEDHLVRFLGTGDDNGPLPLSKDRADFAPRVRQTVSFMLSLPQWQYQ